MVLRFDGHATAVPVILGYVQKTPKAKKTSLLRQGGFDAGDIVTLVYEDWDRAMPYAALLKQLQPACRQVLVVNDEVSFVSMEPGKLSLQ